jgi:hypothetical protein
MKLNTMQLAKLDINGKPRMPEILILKKHGGQGVTVLLLCI